MHTDNTKIASFLVGALAVGLLGYASGVSSPGVWAILFGVVVIPGVVLMRIAQARTKSTSESIREVLR